MTEIAQPLPRGVAAQPWGDLSVRIRRGAEYIVIPGMALAASGLVFSIFLLALGKSPLEFFDLVERGGFGTAFSLQNTLVTSSPLILTALCVALPARIGLVIIGGEGALVLGGFASAAIAIPMVSSQQPVVLTLVVMAVTAVVVGGFWIGIVGYLRHARGVNETISSLLMTYIGIAIMNFFVEGALRDLSNPNKPSTKPIGDAYMIGNIPGTEVHWGLVFGLIAAVISYVLIYHTTFGFAARIAGGNIRAAKIVGLSVGKLVLTICFLAGSCAGLAGMVEVAAVQGRTNANLAAGYGFTGILVAFLARQNPLAIIPVAILLGGISASGGLLQRRLDLPDASVLVLQGIIFLFVLASDALYGRTGFLKGKS